MIRHAAVALAALSVAFPAFAQEAPPVVQAPLVQIVPPPATGPQRPKQPGEFPPFDEVTKDMDSTPGLMTLYRHKPADATKDQTRLLAVVPKSLLKQDLLLAVNISRGDLAGFQYVDGLVRWEQVGRQLKLVAPDTRFIPRPGQPIDEAVQRTYRPSYLFSLPIVTLSPQGDPVIDLGQALFSSTPLVQLPQVGPGAQIRREISQIDSAKSFPDNSLIDVDLAIAGRGGQGGTTMGISYAFRRLPDLRAYRPRQADERVGFFTTDRQDWSAKYTERETIERLVTRWDLKKKDPSLELSPPEKPITFIIDKSVPLQWRRYVAEGISEWNKAFERIGISGAVVVQQQSDDNEFANVDPADARYNFVQWTVRNTTLAVGPSRPDPRTGQILDADIVIDDSWIRYYNEQNESFAPKAMLATLGGDTLRFLAENPAFLPPGMTIEDVKSAVPAQSAELIQSGRVPAAHTPFLPATHQCEMAIGMVQQLAMGQLMGQHAQAKGITKVPDHLIGSALKLLVMHEVGHTLGLRHNFKASSWLPLEEVKKNRDAGLPFVASVMDYAPLAFFADDDINKVRSFASDTTGPYDTWAVEYGYGNPKEGEKEADFLKRTAARNTERELAFATDEDTAGLASSDPLANRYDLSSSSIDWANNQINLTDKLLSNVREWAQKADEPNHYLRWTFEELMFERSRNLSYVSRMVGGQYFSRNRASDPNAQAPITLVESKQQREALDLIGRTVLAEGFYNIDPELLNRLVPTRWSDWNSSASTRTDFPWSRFIENQYSAILFTLSSPQVLQRVYDAEAKSTAADKLTAAELIRSVRDRVWSELAAGPTTAPATAPSDAKPAIGAIRRGMQNTHLKFLLATSESEPGAIVSADLRNLARFALRELSNRIGQTLEARKENIDFATLAHLSEAKSRIDRTLDKPIVDSGMRQSIIILGQEAQQAK